ncbi:MAG: ABC transporter ATP-binding protein [Rhizobiaceae bacterium]
MTALLSVNGIRVDFGGVRAVDDVSLDIKEGRLYGVVGPNGSGKTTLVNAISGIGPMAAGTISLGGADITRLPVHARARLGLARTFQLIRLLPALTVRENVQLAADRLGASPPDRLHGWFGASPAVNVTLERVGLSGVASRRVDTLPYGTQRRVEIARALVGRPRILLLDEPVAGMNKHEREEIAATIRRLADEGLTQLIIEHDLRLLLRMCDELIVMNHGKCLAQGEPKATAALPIVQQAYLGGRS